MLERKRPKKPLSTPEPEAVAVTDHTPDPEPIAIPPLAPPVPVKTEAEYLIATFRVAGMILSARGLLAMSLMGAFILAMVSVTRGGWMPMVTLGLYGLCTVAPLVWLESKRDRA